MDASTCEGSTGSRSGSFLRPMMWRIEIGLWASSSRTFCEYSSKLAVPLAAAIAAL